ncbi:hypothetical protein EEB14_00675 [Rhodococcus sp. WS4]|nr:hypothetical protein EEB14_00675 [Rhodococcus sp. WS4]
MPSEAALVFQIKEGSYKIESLIEFLTDLHGHFASETITLIWGNLSSHKSKTMTAWIAGQGECSPSNGYRATPTTSTPSRWSGATSNRFSAARHPRAAITFSRPNRRGHDLRQDFTSKG